MQSYVIHLIRHGVSEGSLEGRYVGITDSPLSGEGRHQLQELKGEHTLGPRLSLPALCAAAGKRPRFSIRGQRWSCSRNSENAILETGKIKRQKRSRQRIPPLQNGWKTVPRQPLQTEKAERLLCIEFARLLKLLWSASCGRESRSLS